MQVPTAFMEGLRAMYLVCASTFHTLVTAGFENLIVNSLTFRRIKNKLLPNQQMLLNLCCEIILEFWERKEDKWRTAVYENIRTLAIKLSTFFIAQIKFCIVIIINDMRDSRSRSLWNCPLSSLSTFVKHLRGQCKYNWHSLSLSQCSLYRYG